MRKQMGPIAYQLQPPIMVHVDLTGESGLARMDTECSATLAVPVLVAAHQLCTAV